ncbi:hypothetical protein F4819DRAFT_483224 [Hypoxylon fuscum]|nr:hypothetical protein F4819DRAFT_483224 [Hypoxylon fuscum]
MTPQVALITGENTGIGEAIACSLAIDHGYHVIIGLRDLGAGYSVAKHGQRNVLLNSAAIFLESDPRNARLTVRQRIEQTFVPNVFGQAGFTEDMLPLLRKAGETGVLRIVFVSSRLGSLANALDPNAPFYENDFRSYNYSKAALNMPALNYDRMAWKTLIAPLRLFL